MSAVSPENKKKLWSFNTCSIPVCKASRGNTDNTMTEQIHRKTNQVYSLFVCSNRTINLSPFNYNVITNTNLIRL